MDEKEPITWGDLRKDSPLHKTFNSWVRSLFRSCVLLFSPIFFVIGSAIIGVVLWGFDEVRTEIKGARGDISIIRNEQSTNKEKINNIESNVRRHEDLIIRIMGK